MSVLDNAQQYERYILARCPFHDDKNPSLLCFADGWFRCLGCQRSGTWKTLWNKVHGQPVQVRPDVDVHWKGPNIQDQLAEEIAYQANDDLMRFGSLGWYLEMRGLEPMIERAYLGYWKGWYTIPIFDSQYNVKNVCYRSSPPVQEVQGTRYWYRGTPYLYVPDWNLLRDKSNYVVVTYGMLDALTLALMGIPAASPSNGQESFDPAWMNEIRRPIYMLPDQDEERLAFQHAGQLGWRGNVVLLDWQSGIKDPNDFLAHGKRQELESQLQQRIKEYE